MFDKAETIIKLDTEKCDVIAESYRSVSYYRITRPFDEFSAGGAKADCYSLNQVKGKAIGEKTQ